MTDPSVLTEDLRALGYAFRRSDGAAPTAFQVLGERASGTNLARKLLQMNVRIGKTEGLGWKHGFPAMVAIPHDLLVVCVFRNAVDWAISMYKRPWHTHPDMQALEFSRFIRAEWHTIVDRRSHFDTIHQDLRVRGEDLQLDRHPLTGLPFENLFALRRAKMQAFLGMVNRTPNVALVQTEAVQRDTSGFLDAVRAAYHLDSKSPDLRLPARRLGNKYKSVVENRAPAPEVLSQDDLNFMRSQLDLETEAQLGYTY